MAIWVHGFRCSYWQCLTFHEFHFLLSNISDIETLLRNMNDITIHHRNIQTLMIKLFKIKYDLAHPAKIKYDLAHPVKIKYDLAPPVMDSMLNRRTICFITLEIYKSFSRKERELCFMVWKQ